MRGGAPGCTGVYGDLPTVDAAVRGAPLSAKGLFSAACRSAGSEFSPHCSPSSCLGTVVGWYMEADLFSLGCHAG